MKKIDVMWVGLSAKNGKTGEKLSPLGEQSNSGRVIGAIEGRCPGVRFYRTNLVKNVPLDEKGKLRYPNYEEMRIAMPVLLREIQIYRPEIIVLLGGQVSKFIEKYLEQEKMKLSAQICRVYHPSYIYIYKRKHIEDYILRISKKIEDQVGGKIDNTKK